MVVKAKSWKDTTDSSSKVMPGSSNQRATDSISFNLVHPEPLLVYVFPCSPLIRALLGNMRGCIFLQPYRKSIYHSVYFCHYHWMSHSKGFYQSQSFPVSLKGRLHDCSKFFCIWWQYCIGCPAFPYLLKEVKVKPNSPLSIIYHYYPGVSLASENGSQMNKW